MGYWTLFPLMLGLVLVFVTVGIAYAVSSRPSFSLRESGQAAGGRRGARSRLRSTDKRAHEIKRMTGSATVGSKHIPLTKRLYRAGYFTDSAKQKFIAIQIVSVAAWSAGLSAFSVWVFGSAVMATLFGLLGLLIGYIMPLAWLDRCARFRRDEMQYYLPLVIEQISIGVSSSLDIGPCIAHLVNTARERRSHNPVTALFVHAEKLIRSGLNFEGALLEVADAVDFPEIRHAFMFLVQCSKHGGEVSKQLQELADSVMLQRQIQIEGKIAALPVKATGPLATVFAGFFGLLFAGLFVRIATAFG